MREVIVRCTYVISVKVPDDMTDDQIHWNIEANGCPGTGYTGAAFDELWEKSEDEGTCWACEVEGENKVIRIVDHKEEKETTQ